MNIMVHGANIHYRIGEDGGNDGRNSRISYAKKFGVEFIVVLRPDRRVFEEITVLPLSRIVDSSFYWLEII